MLAQRVSTGEWPKALDLPTASGKTACIDIAVYALAAQADRPLADRTAPRRVWFVVDRRIVVDEAFERARKIADALARARAGPLKDVADRLRLLSGTYRPLAVGRLRGGILRDDGWARIPSQPAVVTSTVDQLGSRLLFRGYGHSSLAAPIFAGLAANDSLIILDEAHCTVPFLQTLLAIAQYRGADWAEAPLHTPFAFAVMSATLPAQTPIEVVFPGKERGRALEHPELDRRLRTSKLAELVKVDAKRVAAGQGSVAVDPLVAESARRAAQHVVDGKRRVAVMVNRVHTAESVADTLRAALADRADVVLLSGRIRPFERDGLVERWVTCLRASQPEAPVRPVVVVATQCLEVGADFSFDALVTECASLDALRQRFGRLARLGSDQPARGTILIRERDVTGDEPDAIYGRALAATWTWLHDLAVRHANGGFAVDMGVEALETAVRAVGDPAALLAPTDDAPALLPAHLDLLCQTAPVPHPEPEISLYLHGRPSPPEVSVVWRCDLPPHETAAWAEIVALCPPVSGEMLQVPLWRLRAWLAERAGPDDAADIEGTYHDLQEKDGRIRPCFLWRGRDRSVVATTASQIAPYDVVVVPAAYGIAGLGHAIGAQAVGAEGLDLLEAALERAGRSPIVRLNRAVLAPWLDIPPVEALAALAEMPVSDREEIQVAAEAVLTYQPADAAPPAPPGWWIDLLRRVLKGRFEDHPAGGLVLFGRATASTRAAAEPDLFADDDDLACAGLTEITLDDHTSSVRRAAVKITRRCLPRELEGVAEQVATWHDAGKLDSRFQAMLRRGDEVAVAMATAPLAKSATMPMSPALRSAMREVSGLPENFRHEMLSLLLTERFGGLPGGRDAADLVLHLIASHHGHGRPFAPVCLDTNPPAVSGQCSGVEITLDATARLDAAPAHRLDSGVTDRFWRLTRRYGWWGVAYLEAILRMADWYGSAFVIPAEPGEEWLG
jgi:CRISPR-associated endonuclease/helicase Cas3